MIPIESLLFARLFVRPQLAGERLYFISNLSGRMSLYAMDTAGTVPEPLLPPDIAMQNPHLLEGYPYYVFPSIDTILVMLDKDGDENYQPMRIPLFGGYPEPVFPELGEEHRLYLGHCDRSKNIAYLMAESRLTQKYVTYQAHLSEKRLVRLGESEWTLGPAAANHDHTRVLLLESYTTGDHVLYLWEKQASEMRLLYGKPLEARRGEPPVLTGFFSPHFTKEGEKAVLGTALFENSYGLAVIDLKKPEGIQPIKISGLVHTGAGELCRLTHTVNDRYLLEYNIDGSSWLYEGQFDSKQLSFTVQSVLCGQPPLADGVLESFFYDIERDRLSLAFSTATSPTQIYTLEGGRYQTLRQYTHEKLLGLPADWLSPGEDASFVSFDGRRISARLYLPSKQLGYSGARPVVYYVHGGPQGQERPDFAWFSMPLIQFLALNGFAIFVPNVRGSTGYGLDYVKQVDRDWGGQDRLDHVYAMQHVLSKDKRLDISRAGVVGRSYGGYMSLTLAGRHPDLWKAAVDMFGPYDLLTFSDRIPESWKPYFAQALGNPADEADRAFLVERSPRNYLHQMSCPMLVIQGKNDPRVVLAESNDLVEALRAAGKEVEFLVFQNEGHDVLKFENRVTCYNAITGFFKKHLAP
ncbi:MAG: prolyl oligopeptidase family serine peptidase [Anaerolineales bacterium]|nr:prolyl oligopeptidase family serine peptidase [Anaerolineales bacterium]